METARKLARSLSISLLSQTSFIKPCTSFTLLHGFTPLLLYLAPLSLLKLIKNPLVHMQSVALFMQECVWMGEAREIGQKSLVLYSV
jgi:hypothetical protein